MESDDAQEKRRELMEQLADELATGLLYEKIPLDVVNSESGEIMIPANQKITMALLRKVVRAYNRIEIDPSPTGTFIRDVISGYERKLARLDREMSTDQSIIELKKHLIDLERRAKAGDAEAQYKLGCRYYDSGALITRNRQKAKALLQAASEQGYIPALIFLGDCYVDEGNNRKAKECYRKAAAKENADGQFRLAKLSGDADALSLYYEAAKKGHAKSQTELGDRWADGRESWLRNYGVALWEYTAERESEESDGVDTADSLKNRQARDGGNHCFSNRFCRYCGRARREVVTFQLECKWGPTPKLFDNDSEEKLAKEEDRAEAAEWYCKGAEQGYPEAQRKLGDCYTQNWIIAKTCKEAAEGHRNKEAVKWYRKAAEQGDTESMVRLGDCYAAGNGVRQSEMEAAKWYRKAEAYEELGHLYATIGDKRKAAKAYRQAGFHWASSEIRDLGPKSTW